MVGRSIEDETAGLFPKLCGNSSRHLRKRSIPAVRQPAAGASARKSTSFAPTFPTVSQKQAHIENAFAAVKGLDPYQRHPNDYSTLLAESNRARGAQPKVNYRHSVAQSAQKIRQSARKNATGISHYTDEPGRNGLTGQFLDHHLPNLQHPGAVCGNAENGDKAWLASVFPTHLPASREDVMRLREYTEARISQLEDEAERNGNSLTNYAEEAIRLYTMGFQELTRQVSLQCVERGRLMADLWASHTDIMTRVVHEIRDQKEDGEIIAMGTKKRNQMLEGQIEGLQQMLLEKRIQLKAMTDKMAELQKAVLGHDFTGTVTRMEE
ncbi:hypothetical protein BSKO_12658 [Bryopsis sp. KO-2023]|nr:hypothetical protein BSKO_12658 [Bryopsis sp. KO-2023]